MNAVVSMQSDTITKALNHIAKQFPFFKIEIFMMMERGCVRVRFVYDNGLHKFVGFGDIDEMFIFRASSPDLCIVDNGIKYGYSFIGSLPEAVVGKYAITRHWHDTHLNSSQRLFGYPELAVEGWVHNKYRGQTPREGLSDRIAIQHVKGPSVVEDDEDYTDRLKGSVIAASLRDVNNREGLIEVATGKKKKVVRTTPPLVDPSKIKKPQCPKHDTDMKFNPVRGKWTCTYDGCKMVSTPKRDEDDRSVTLGKGETSLRIVCTDDGKTTVLLISDDNIALDISRYVDIDEFVTATDLLSTAKIAAESGRDEFTETEPRSIGVSVRVGLIGVDNLIVNHETKK